MDIVNSDQVVVVENVTLTLAEDVILDHVDISFGKGTVTGLIGRNGSGKTVLMKCICGFFHPDEGRVLVRNRVVGKEMDFPENLGILIESPGFLGNFSGYENLRLLAMIQNKIGKEEIMKAMERVSLNPKLKKSVAKYSLGMKQRLGIAQAMMEDPDIILLDEPMNALDSSGVQDIRELIIELKASGKTILLSSHNKEDIDTLCDAVYLMEKGKLVCVNA